MKKYKVTPYLIVALLLLPLKSLAMYVGPQSSRGSSSGMGIGEALILIFIVAPIVIGLVITVVSFFLACGVAIKDKLRSGKNQKDRDFKEQIKQEVVEELKREKKN